MPRIPSLPSRSLLVGLVLLLTALPAFAQGKRHGWQAWVADELLIGFHAGITSTEGETVYSTRGARRLEESRHTKVHRIRVPSGALDAIEAALASDPRVKFVERNRLLPPGMVLDDPAFWDQWHLHRIGAPEAWDVTAGEPIVIAVLDSGVDPAHPDLAGHLVPGYNFWDNNADTVDVHGHGTLVAGTAAAIGGNATGVAGVAPLARIMPIRVTGTNGWASAYAIAQGLMWAVDHGAKVMNVSFGGVAGSYSITSAAQYVASQGGIVVAAAGNCGCVDGTPKNSYILSVAATDSGDNLAYFSSRGEHVDLAAPGVDIMTTAYGGGYGSVAGTSFSSPITAGVIALMMAANPRLTPADLEGLLLGSVDDLGSGGWDSGYGYGRVNAGRAVQAARASAAGPDVTPPTVSITSPANGATVGGRVTVNVAATDDNAVARVDVFVDGTLLASDVTPPYSFSWNTTSLPAGPHVLMAVAVDGTGNTSTSAVTVWVPTPTLAVTPDTVAAGGTVTVTVTNGPGNPTDWVGLYQQGAGDTAHGPNWQYLGGTKNPPGQGRTSATLTFTMPATPGMYELRLFANNGYARLTTSPPVTVGLEPGSTLAVTPTSVNVGGTVTVTISSGPANPTDWVGLYRQGAADAEHGPNWQYLDGMKNPPSQGWTSATLTFTMTTPGVHEFRLFADNGYTRLATSSTVSVTGSPPMLAVAPTTVTVGGTVTVTVANGPGNPTDWVGLYLQGAGDREHGPHWQYLDGTKTAPSQGRTSATLTFTMPTTPGAYEFRLFANNGYTRLAIGPPLTVP